MGVLYGCQDTASVTKVCQGGVSRLDDGGGVQGDVRDQQHHDDPHIQEEPGGDHIHLQVQGEGGGRVVAPSGEGGVGAGRGGHDQHHAGPEGVQGGRVREEGGGNADDVHPLVEELMIHTSSRLTFQTSTSKKP